jgi:subtilisin family serine protease
MKGVQGGPDALEQHLSQPPLMPFVGHGTFVAGVARCMAPHAKIFVANLMPASGAELESSITEKLDLMIQERKPDIINLSAGTYTRHDFLSLGFEDLHRQHPNITVVAAAGNDHTTRPFHPAAEKWTVSVGALGADEQHLAYFSNHCHIDVYALGEGLVNAYATGDYVYTVPPKQGAIQTFAGMARWSGTSFSAPLVAGLIADEMWRTKSTANMAAQAVLDRAQHLAGVGPVLRIS